MHNIKITIKHYVPASNTFLEEVPSRTNQDNAAIEVNTRTYMQRFNFKRHNYNQKKN